MSEKTCKTCPHPKRCAWEKACTCSTACPHGSGMKFLGIPMVNETVDALAVAASPPKPAPTVPRAVFERVQAEAAAKDAALTRVRKREADTMEIVRNFLHEEWRDHASDCLCPWCSLKWQADKALADAKANPIPLSPAGSGWLSPSEAAELPAESEQLREEAGALREALCEIWASASDNATHCICSECDGTGPDFLTIAHAPTCLLGSNAGAEFAARLSQAEKERDEARAALVIAADTIEEINAWLGSASTREAAEDSLHRLARKLADLDIQGTTRQTGKWRMPDPLHWRGELLHALDRVGFGCGVDGEIRQRLPTDKNWERASGPTIRGFADEAAQRARDDERQRLLLEHAAEVRRAVEEEREACANVADGGVTRDEPAAALTDWQRGYSRGRQDAAAAIRARGVEGK